MSKIVIFPHAGAVRSGYGNLEDALGERFEVVYINYEKRYKQCQNQNFTELIRCIRDYLEEYISHEEQVVFLGHSMGAYILYAMSDYLQHAYSVKKLIYSDVRPPAFYQSLKLKDMDQVQREKVLETYAFSDEIRSVEPLYQYFKGILLEDLLILDSMEAYTFEKPLIDSNTKVLLCYSDYSAHKNLEREWAESFSSLDKMDTHFFKGGHYYFEKYTVETVNVIAE